MVNQTITIPRSKYEDLQEVARAYEALRKSIKNGGFFSVPLVRDRRIILDGFKKSKSYNKKFLQNLENGLKRSDYFV